ncbi:TolC family outer membrane protein [Rickettsiella massiliensis]|uniref:TolC family outer membrane protein n=1 Tax=Rickettsiella massiliensis TaxID=676517 RepID=UPI00029AA7E2|nr:TolC family outer membrane protein [Rickettsiella massiliensis]
MHTFSLKSILRKKTAFIFVGVGLLMARFTPCYATDLMDVYHAALTHDAVYQAAVSTRLATHEALPLSIAALLPSVNAQANVTSNYNTQANVTSNYQATGFNPPITNQGYGVSLSQPLLNVGSWLQVQQATCISKKADAVLGVAAQSLIYRVANAYFQVLLAQDTLRFAQAEKAANAQKLDQAQKRVRVGLDAITAVYEAKAAYDSAVAAEISAQNTLRNNQEAIRQLTGQTYSDLQGFHKTLPLFAPQPQNVGPWIQSAIQYNLDLMASRYAVQIARKQIQVQASDHLPTLNLVGSYGRNNGINAGIIDGNSATVGVQLELPIFAGGAILSNTRKAEYDYQTAVAQLEDTYRKTIVTTRQKYNDVLADISSIQAERQAIQSAQKSLQSTEESVKAGTRTMVDVLLAQKNLYDAKRNAAKDQTQYLLDSLLLKQTAGLLQPADLQHINQWMKNSDFAESRR